MKKNNIFVFVMGIAFFALLFVLRHSAYPEEVVAVCGFIFDYATGLLDSLGVLKNLSEMYAVYGVLVRGIFAIVSLAVGIALLKIFPEKMAQSSAAVYCDIGKTIKCGACFTFLNIFLVLMLLNSVVGIAIAITNLAVFVIISILGMFGFSVALGSYFQYLYNGDNRSISINYLIGVLTLNICGNIYGFRELMWLFILPVLGTGSFIWSAYNMIMHRHFDTSLVGVKKEHFDRSKIRDIITRGID